MSRPVRSLAAVVALLVAGLGVAAATTPERARHGAAALRRTVPVALAGGVCPDPVSDAGSQTRVGLAAPGPLRSGSSGSATSQPGSVALTDLGGTAAPRATLSAPSAGTLLAPPKSPPLVAAASGALAPGFAASMVTRTVAGDLRGLAGTTCPAAGTDFWFVGSGAVVGQRGRLYLSNPEPAPAVVDVVLYGPDGPIDAPGGRGIAVAPGAQRVVLLDALSPDTARFGVHVQVEQGRVSAAVRDQQVAGLDPRGTDWVPVAVAPRRHLVVPGVPAAAGESRLQILVPGGSDAIVKVRLIGTDGSFAPTGLDVVQASAGAVTDIDLTPHTKGQNVAVDLTSDQPVTAGVLTRVGGAAGQLGEIGYTAAADALGPAQPATEAQAWTGTNVGTTLMLAAPGAGARVEVAPLPPATGTAQTVDVPAGTLAVLDLAKVSTAPVFGFTVVPEAGSGPVVASRQISALDPHGPMLTIEPLQPGRFAVAVPSAHADLSAGLRPRR